MEEKEILQRLSDTIQNTDCDMNDFQRLKECFIEIKNLVEGKNCVIETQAHNEEILMKQLEEKDREIARLNNIKNICPAMGTSGIKCDLKEQLEKQIDLMSEDLTTDYHSRDWVKQYYENKVKEGNKNE